MSLKMQRSCWGFQILLLSLFLSTAYITALMWIPIHVADMKSVTVVTDHPVAGDDVVIEVTMEKYEKLTAEVTVQLVDRFVTLYPTFKSNLPVGHTSTRLAFRIPGYVDTRAHFIVTLNYYPNPFRTETYVAQSEDFQIYDE